MELFDYRKDARILLILSLPRMRAVDPSRVFDSDVRRAATVGSLIIGVVSVLVSVATIHGCSSTVATPTRRLRWMSTNARKRAGAELESGLGSRPRGFESRILRCADKGKQSPGTFR